MIREKDLRLERALYHRNGIAGEGFHVVEFKLKADHKIHPLLAIVFETKGQCAVVSPGEPFSKFRGDEFEPYLRTFIAKRESEAHAYEQSKAQL